MDVSTGEFRATEVDQAEVSAALETMNAREALCHGDYTPKNMLVHEQGFMLVDYETAYFGDPTMDLGLFLSHLVLDEFYSVDFMGVTIRFNKYAGSALKFFSPSWGATLTTYVLLGLLGGLAYLDWARL